jgi:predicted GIY-YIG superfamily endonuclease
MTTYVYILRSISEPGRHYVGVTADLRDRLLRHNRGEVTHTSKYAPWQIEPYVAFADQAKAHAFERYLKPGSGKAFSTRHF